MHDNITELHLTLRVPKIAIEQAIIDSGVENKEYLFSRLHYPSNDLGPEIYDSATTDPADAKQINARNWIRQESLHMKKLADIQAGYIAHFVIFSSRRRFHNDISEGKIREVTLRDMLAISAAFPSLPYGIKKDIVSELCDPPLDDKPFLKLSSGSSDCTKSCVSLEYPEWDTDSTSDYIVSPETYYYLIGKKA